MQYRRSFKSFQHFLCLFLSVVLLLIGLSLPSQAEIIIGRRSSTAPIVLDGKVLFQVTNLPKFLAKDRAKQANESLKKALQELAIAEHSSSTLDQVVRVQSGPLPTLRLVDRHLLTVTDRDVQLGKELIEQAQEWKATIDKALAKGLLERTPAYRQQALIKSGRVIFLAVILHCCIQWIRLRRRRKQLRTMQEIRRPLIPLGLTLLQVLVLGWAGYYICELFPQFRSLLYVVLRSFDEPIFSLNQQEYGIVDLLVVLGLILGLWVIVRGLTLLLKSKILQILGVNRGLQDAIAVLTQYILTALGVVVILQVLEVDISALLIVGSALGLGIGFGLQNIVNNFISGIFILLDRPIEVGDFINVGDLTGTVEQIGTRSTEIRTLDEVTIIIPNSQFLEKEVLNWNHGSSVSQIHLPVGVAYGCDINLVQQALIEAVSSNAEVLAHPQPKVAFLGFGDNVLDFEVLVWLREPRKQFRLKSNLYYQIVEKLRSYQIEIPFPQRDLHVKSPQLEQLIELLMQQIGEKIPKLYFPNSLKANSSSHSSTYRNSTTSDELTHPQYPDINLEELVAQMRGDQGLDFQDRRHRLNVYPQCFVGAEAVIWLMNTQRATRKEAIRIGQLLIQNRIIHHVLDEHPFDDAYLFYRFYEDE